MLCSNVYCIYNPQVQLTLELKDLTLIIIIDHNMVTVHNMAIGHNMGIITGPNMLSIGFEKACGYQIIQLSEEPWTIGTYCLQIFKKSITTIWHLHTFP